MELASRGGGGGGEMPHNASPRAARSYNHLPPNPRPMKFSLYPASRPRTASGDSDSSMPSTPISPTSAPLPPLPLSPESTPTSSSFAAQRSFPAYPSANSDPRPPPAPPILHHKPSEASRLRALNNGYRSHSSDGRSTPENQDYHSPRPRQASGGLRKEPSRPSLFTSNTFPLRTDDAENIPPLAQSDARERGLSTSSSKSTLTQHSAPLRPSISIPDYHAPDSIYSRQRNLSTSAYRPGRGLARNDYEYSSPHREYYGRPTGLEGDEIRASIRSALTTNSSFMGTSGTERSSVMTKSSSATSLYGKDEGMSVDDAIGMYELGFQDSGVEDNEDEDDRPDTAHSQNKRALDLEEAMNDDILPSQNAGHGHETNVVDAKASPPPPPKKDDDSNKSNGRLAPPKPIDTSMIRDSGSFFRPGLLDTPKSSPVANGMGLDGMVDIEEGYFSGKTISRPGTSANNDPARDRYGFKKETQHTTRAQYDAWNATYSEYIARRRRKWIALQKDSGLITEDPDRFPPKSVKVKRFVRKGIPPEWRGAAWFYYAGGPAMVAKHHGVYSDLVRRAQGGGVTETDDEIIERDLNRTFPDNVYFKPDSHSDFSNNAGIPPPETPMLQSLRRVLQAFSIYNPKIGYCQSLNFLSGLLLLFMDEEKAFWMLNIITRVYLPGTHDVNLEGANVDLGVLMTAIREMMPSIWAKVGGELDGSPFAAQSTRLPPITLCTTAWFMSCFIGTLPIETTLRVWDSFFYEGSKTLFRIALTIFKIGETEIKNVSDPMEIFQVVQTIPRKLIDANLVMESCFKRRNGFGHISQETIEKGRAERRKGYAEERERLEGGVPAATRTPGRKNTLFSRKRRGPSDTP